MATGRAGREERLNERLRGAQRVNVEADESFSLNIADITALPVATTSPSLRAPQIPNSSVKRKRASPKPVSRSSQPPDRPSSSLRNVTNSGSTTSRPKAVEDLPDVLNEPADPIESPQAPTPAARTATPSIERTNSDRNEQDDLATSPTPTATTPKSAQSLRRAPTPRSVPQEIVLESPATAPGSGKRRRLQDVQDTQAPPSSARLQALVIDDVAGVGSSSPLAEKSRRMSGGTALRWLGRSSRIQQPMSDEVDEVDEVAEVPAPAQDLTDTLGSSPPVRRTLGAEQAGQGDSPAGENVETEEAEEISATEAAQVLGKRARQRKEKSPELGSIAQNGEGVTSAPKAKRGRPVKSPAAQKQPVNQKLTAKRASISKQAKRLSEKSEKPAKKKQRRSQQATEVSTSQEVADEAKSTIDITIQRFVNWKTQANDNDGNTEDPLHSNDPCEAPVGEKVTVIDVLAQVCHEVAAHMLIQLGDIIDKTPDPKAKKILRIKMRAVEAYREELSSRLLQHAIHLNHLHSLRKRVREAQKEKFALRAEILRLRAEREQVALQMDAVRIKHEATNKEATYRLNTSAMMQNIELALGLGHDAPDLTGKKKTEAELGNLELLIAQAAESAGLDGGGGRAAEGGGLLGQIKDFNAFLERAAVALEMR